RGVTPEYLEIKRWVVANGASFSTLEAQDGDHVCLIGQTVREQLFGDADPVGEMIRINGWVFRVVGLLAPKGQSATGQDQDDTILLPYVTAQRKLKGKGVSWLDDILCSAVSAEAVEPARLSIIALLRQRHHIGVDDDDDFNIRRPEELIKADMAASDA